MLSHGRLQHAAEDTQSNPLCFGFGWVGGGQQAQRDKTRVRSVDAIAGRQLKELCNSTLKMILRLLEQTAEW